MRKEFRNETFDMNFLLMLGQREKDATKEIKKWLKTATPEVKKKDTAHAYCFAKNRGIALWFASLKPGPGLIAHECAHAVTHIFSFNEMCLTENNEEVFACLMEWLVAEIWRVSNNV